ncbi:MAG TPA: hypothetical protein VHK01_08245 [Lacipirellulaceae bacterium]|nr:hypothetical protein [Lacipirellulaceae bacterium]
MMSGRPGRNVPNLGSTADLRRLSRGTAFGPVRELGRPGLAASASGPISELGRPGSPGRIFEPPGEAGRPEPSGRLFDRAAGEPGRAGPFERFFDPAGDQHRPGGIGEPGRFDRPGGFGDPAKFPGFDGLESLASSGASEGRSSTAPIDWQSLANQADQVRGNYSYDDCFSGSDWWGRYATAWVAAEWVNAAASAYSTASWDDCSSYGGYASEPIYYDYGTNVVYEGDTVYVNGDAVATEEQYAQEATTLADTGAQAQATEEEDWLTLGVFAMIQGEQMNGNDLFQLAVNKSGVIRGNYYNALSDSTLPVYGSADKKTQRAAWRVGDRKEPIFEVGLANLTKPQTTMLVHFGKERTQQWTLVRIDKSPSASSN